MGIPDVFLLASLAELVSFGFRDRISKPKVQSDRGGCIPLNPGLHMHAHIHEREPALTHTDDRQMTDTESLIPGLPRKYICMCMHTFSVSGQKAGIYWIINYPTSVVYKK